MLHVLFLAKYTYLPTYLPTICLGNRGNNSIRCYVNQNFDGCMMLLSHVNADNYPKTKSQTGLSSLWVSCKRALLEVI